MIEVVVCGVAGRMGQRLAQLVASSDDLELVGAVEQPGHPAVGRDIGALLGQATKGWPVAGDPRQVVERGRVVIDFTAPEATLACGEVCAARGASMVVGTTGLTSEQREEFVRRVASIPCVLAPNYSTAMNVLFRLVEQAARILGDDYDVEVVEAHHRLKVDAPSGSALRLAEQAAAGLRRNLSEVAVYGRQGVVGKRTQKEIGIHAVRAGDLVGDHRVLFGAAGECLELQHRATSRDAFALGALRAVRFVARAKPGLYDMGDVLGIG
jgi:4-hydroxy-tetrahydrodipicolinate reductase